MLPVMALRVQPGSTCLDVCASPGSKTMQLLEAVTVLGGEGSASSGLVLANDAHPKRAATLIEAIKRHGRPAHELQSLVITCHRGEELPTPSRPFGGKASKKEKQRSADDEATAAGAVGFDFVLTDVPCSGDGTIRKDSNVLPRWTPAVSNQLHGTQLDIAWRGLQAWPPPAVCSRRPSVIAAACLATRLHAPARACTRLHAPVRQPYHLPAAAARGWTHGILHLLPQPHRRRSCRLCPSRASR